MKTGEQIVSQLMTPFGRRWQDRRCIKALLLFLPFSMTRSVRYAKFQENTLVIALDSSASKMEFYQKRSVIKAIFKKLKEQSASCKDREIDDFRFFILPPEPKPMPETEPFFYELSSGEFENRATNKEIYKMIEEIREIIKRRKKRS